MVKLLKAFHITMLLMLLLYCGLILEQFLAKLIDPRNSDLRFWEPSVSIVFVFLMLVALLGIFSCSTGLLKKPSWLLTVMLQSVWLICFTWLGWFDAAGPFRLRELVGVSFGDPEGVRRAQWIHFLQAGLLYTAIAITIGLPLILGRSRTDYGASPRSGQ